ncbi:unnamed protein product, partial [Rotaria sp. Silwood1]
VNKKRLIDKRKCRRKELVNNKSKTIEIHVNRDSKSNLYSSSNIEIIHQSNCRYNQIGDSLSNRTGASISPSIGDAPAASPEQSYILDSIHTTNGHLDNIDIIQHSSPFYCDQDNSSIPSILLNNISINKQPIKSNYLDLENTDKYLEENPCDCYCQYIENKKLNINNEEEEEEEEEDDDDDDDNKIKRKSKISIYMNKYIWSYLNRLHKSISNFVAGKYFRRIVLSAIVVNTLSMGIEHHGQPQSLTNALEYSNLVFTSLFAIEMILKIIANGCLQYIKNAYNLFDSVIVIMSLIELQGNKNSGLSVLRTFRLLRVLKLVRFMPTLRRQL